MANIIGNRMKALRLEKETTIAELANIINMSPPAISNYERGERSPDAETIIKLAKYFECSTDYLLGLSEFRNESSIKQHDHMFFDLSDSLSGLSCGTEFMENILSIIKASKELAPFLHVKKGDTELLFFLFNIVVRDIAKSLEETCRYTSQEAPHDFTAMGLLSDAKRGDAVESVYRIYRNIIIICAFVALEEGADVQKTLDSAYTLIRRTGLPREFWNIFGKYDDMVPNKEGD